MYWTQSKPSKKAYICIEMREMCVGANGNVVGHWAGAGLWRALLLLLALTSNKFKV